MKFRPRRWVRRIFSLLVVSSLLACVAMGLIWWHSSRGDFEVLLTPRDGPSFSCVGRRLDGEACLYISIVDAWDHPSAATWYTSSSKLEWQMWFFHLIFADSGRRDVYVSEFWSKAGITYMDGH